MQYEIKVVRMWDEMHCKQWRVLGGRGTTMWRIGKGGGRGSSVGKISGVIKK